MVRTVTQKYQIWLAGYYDDFNGARAIPDYRNTPSSTSTYTHLASHHGNPLNGEAFLNPRYRWSVEERRIDSNKVAGDASRVSGTSPVNNFLMNDGLFEWLTFDDTRLGRTTTRVEYTYNTQTDTLPTDTNSTTTQTTVVTFITDLSTVITVMLLT